MVKFLVFCIYRDFIEILKRLYRDLNEKRRKKCEIGHLTLLMRFYLPDEADYYREFFYQKITRR